MFERVANQQGWPEDIWAMQLAGLLTGKAMAAFASLSTEESGDFEKVKAAILQRYEVNEETHRRRLRNDRKKGGETYREWVYCLQDRLQKWVKSQTLPWEQLVLMEQVYESVPQDLAVCLRKRKPPSVQKLVSDDYNLARRGIIVVAVVRAGTTALDHTVEANRTQHLARHPPRTRQPTGPTWMLGGFRQTFVGRKGSFSAESGGT